MSPPVAAASALRDEARAALRSSAASGAEILLFRVPAPRVCAETALAASGETETFLWAPPQGSESVGFGIARELSASGPDRFGAIRDQAAALWPRIQAWGLPAATSPRLFGGFAFQVGRAASPPWCAFGEARFVLPRLAYSAEGEDATLTLAIDTSMREDPAAFGSLLLTAERLLSRLELDAPIPDPGPATVRAHAAPSRGDWTTLVEAIRAGITAGRFEKVVAAQRAVLELDQPPQVPVVLSRLRRIAGESTRFALRHGTTTFLGATPERLLRKRGNSLETEAIAGSIRPGGAATEHELLASGKDHREHAFVVRELLRCLEPISLSLEYPGQPRVQCLRHVLHLRTPVHATLRECLHVIDLVERLHPTPAVGGVPTRGAMDWIAANEPVERGWYAGPIGWFDALGDGEFVVALRSGVVDGRSAHLYAGAGIVADSDAVTEYAETQLKLALLLDALAAI